MFLERLKELVQGKGLQLKSSFAARAGVSQQAVGMGDRAPRRIRPRWRGWPRCWKAGRFAAGHWRGRAAQCGAALLAATRRALSRWWVRWAGYGALAFEEDYGWNTRG